MPRRLFAICLLLCVASAAFGATQDDSAPKGYPSIADIQKGGGCAPKDNTARVLKSAHPLDLAPNWTGTQYIGLAWTFMPKRYVVVPDVQGGIYLQGNLITTRGALMPDDLFILYAEWDCAKARQLARPGGRH